MKLKSIREIKNLKNKRVLLRVDFNVPTEGGKVKDNWRIRAAIPTLEFFHKKGAKVVIIGHLGRPKAIINPKFEIRNPKQPPHSPPISSKAKQGELEEVKLRNPKFKIQNLSLKPVFNYLKKLINFKIDFTNAAIGSKVLARKIQKMKTGGVLMLENIRFYAGEEANDKEFAKKLAGLGDVFVNDAFAVSHRNCASITGIAKFLPSYAGLNLEKEVEVLGQVLKQPKKPMVVLMGGAKISDKIGAIKKLLPKTKVVLLGGALANNFLKAGGWSIGDSLYDKDGLAPAKKLLKNGKVVWPIDVVITDSKKVDARTVNLKKKNLCPKGWKIVDIGPRTIKLYSDNIRKAQTIVWNGPMGLFEDKRFSYGSLAIAQVVGSRSTGKAFGVVGGGETIEVLRKSGMEKYIDWVSTGGGAMLEFLEKGTLTGLESLIKK